MDSYLTLNNLISLIKVILDIGIVSVVFYFCLRIVRNNSRTIQIFKGILFIFIINALAQLIGLKAVQYLSTQFLNWGFLAIIIIFQPEIRSLLEKLGKSTVYGSFKTLSMTQKEKLVDELVRSSQELSRSRTGAIISIEQTNSLADYIKTGTPMDSVVTEDLLLSIFYEGTPLHDGAVIIRGDKIACASAYFPPTTKDFPSIYGARHRAAVGISEISDCITIVVSEETGRISIAREGMLTNFDSEGLKEYLMNNITNVENAENNRHDNQPVYVKSEPFKNRSSNEAFNDDEDQKIEAEAIVMLPKKTRKTSQRKRKKEVKADE